VIVLLADTLTSKSDCDSVCGTLEREHFNGYSEIKMERGRGLIWGREERERGERERESTLMENTIKEEINKGSRD
jgi:hypothetical protein